MPQYLVGLPTVASPVAKVDNEQVGTSGGLPIIQQKIRTIGDQPVASLDAVSADAVGDILTLGTPRTTWGLQVFTEGTVTEAVVSLYLSLDGTHFDPTPLLIWDISNGQASGNTMSQNNAVGQYAYAELTDFSGSGTITAIIAAV